MATRNLPANDDRRTAWHEAGHATVAWFCTAVIHVESATIVSDGEAAGRVVTVIDRNIPLNEWCELVFAMAGVAAESLEFGGGHAMEAAGDLASSRAIIDHLRGAPPWPEPDGPTLPWRTMFRSRVSERDAALLTFAFRTAMAILINYRSRVAQLAGLLLASRRIAELDMVPIFGSRAPWVLDGRWYRIAKFVVIPTDEIPARTSKWGGIASAVWRTVRRLVDR